MIQLFDWLLFSYLIGYGFKNRLWCTVLVSGNEVYELVRVGCVLDWQAPWLTNMFACESCKFHGIAINEHILAIDCLSGDVRLAEI